MPRFDFIRETTAAPSFRVEQVKSGFDLQTDHITEHFKGDIAIEGKAWNIGLIVGRSGTGKSTIAREVFAASYPKPHEYGTRAIVDEMPGSTSYKEITALFTAVGFSSPPSWLKPYAVLSNGERMRVDLAYAILSDADPIVFDEFTSVVDRDIAKICSYAMAKSVRSLGRKFIAISCHDDIIDWLEPDWVYDTNSQTFTFLGRQRTRPAIQLDIIHCADKKAAWEIFRKYHYLNTDIHKGADCYIAVLAGKPVAFVAMLQFPHPLNKTLCRVHRWVTLPDYQGVGIGTALLNRVSSRYKAAGRDVRLVSSQINVMRGLKANWMMMEIGRGKKFGNSGLSSLNKTNSCKRTVASMKYTGA
jgi:ABC-type lipoprotein export system ATPase subunit/GNAT superfamily N-acetyltransferase